MNKTKHLKRIRARCVELLAIAEKRTPGKWHAEYCKAIDRHAINVYLSPFTGQNLGRFGPQQGNDALFIASCAGAAEAGWRSTIAAIDCIDDMPEHIGNLQTSLILTAWPEELLS